MENLCPQCGAPVKAGANKCEYCGAQIAAPAAPAQAAPTVQVYNNYAAPNGNPAINPAWPIKNKLVAGILAILLGGLGIHEFYLGRTGKGVLMLLLCWTYIPGIIGFIQGIMILCSNDENFQLKYKVRIQ